jgi:NAD+ synthase (glutamine-hydrolysing)
VLIHQTTITDIIKSEALNKKLTWETDDLALQNIQAHVRSEVALGYATMNGDTSGSLSSLAGIDKDFLRHWLRWLEKSIPTAELRPAAMT